MKMKFCPDCAKEMEDKIVGDGDSVRFCSSCKNLYFDNPAPCVLVCVVNEKNQVLLLKSKYISKTKWTLVAGYVTGGETLEETVFREVMEETGQKVEKLEYISSYYFEQKDIIMAGFMAWVKENPFNNSKEVDDLFWCKVTEVDGYINRDNNLSGIHFDNCKVYIS